MRFFLKPLLAGVIAASSIAPAFADPPRWSNARGNDYRYDRDYRDGYRDGRRDYRRDDRRWERQHWKRGDYFDRRVQYVVVNDYNRYRLPPPRRGEYYARTNTGEILLIAAATGLVLWALTN